MTSDEPRSEVLGDIPTGPRLSARLASTVEPAKPEWIVQGWVLRRALGLITGKQGGGKTTFAAHLIGLITTGRPFPGDRTREPMKAAILSLEEPDDRIVARLSAAGADLDRVSILGTIEDIDEHGQPFPRRWQLPKDITTLGRAIEEHDLDLVVIDGLGYSISGDSHNYAVVGSALASLAAEAERTGAAIIGLVHPPKGRSDPLTAAIGSTAWTAIPRVCMVLGVDPNDEGKRVTRVAKSNYRYPDAGVEFTIDNCERHECGYVTNLRPSNVTAEEITAGPTSQERTDRAEARDFLCQVLADGSMPSDEVRQAAERAGISPRTLARARKDLGIVTSRQTDPETGRMTGWVMALPHGATPPCQPTPAMAPWHSGHSGHHQEEEVVSAPEGHLAESGTLDGEPEEVQGCFERSES